MPANRNLRLLRDKGITLQLSEVVGDYITRWERRNASVIGSSHSLLSNAGSTA